MNSQTESTEKPHKQVTIFVNTQPVAVQKEKYTYEEIVAFAYPAPDFQNNTYKVTYFRDPEKKGGQSLEGALTKGESINVKDGMAFTVVRAVKS